MTNAIQNEKELEFAIFCIENVALRLGVGGEKVFEAMAEKSDILYQYIVPNYDVLHTQGKDYIVDDILETVRERGIVI